MKKLSSLIASASVGTIDPPGGFIPADPATGDSILRRGFNVALALAGVIAVAMIIYAGIKYMMSNDPGKIKEAQSQLTYAIIGLVVVLMAFVVVEFVAGVLGAPSIFNSPFTPN